MPDKLVLDGVTLEPYAYSEDFENDHLKIIARVKVSGSQEDELKKQRRVESFQVIRCGINEEPLEMNFGFGNTISIRSEHENGNKYLLTLYEKSSESSDERGKIPSSKFSNVHEYTLINTFLTVRGIIDTLAKKGALTSEEIAEIHSKAEDESFFPLVHDIDAFE